MLFLRHRLPRWGWLPPTRFSVWFKILYRVIQRLIQHCFLSKLMYLNIKYVIATRNYMYEFINTGVTGQNIPQAGFYPGLKRPRLNYTRVFYGLGQFIPRGILWPRTSHTLSGQIIPP